MGLVEAYKRPKEMTQLREWLQENNMTMEAFARKMGTNKTHVGWWATGRTLPGLIYAFRIEQVTAGGVPASYWLGTLLGKMQWNSISSRARRLTALPVLSAGRPVKGFKVGKGRKGAL
jgi:transcriptional regulator with XRE-family HTH domain